MISFKKDAIFDITGIGSALLDFTVEVDDDTLKQFDLEKGGMQLIDETRSREILDKLKNRPLEISPGGSAANTVAGVSNFGGSALFIGKVGNDSHGARYIEDTEKSGVRARLGRNDHMTGHAITFITPDRERTFATHLGAAQRLSSSDIHEEDIGNSRIVHIEGYLFEPPGLREACMRAMEIAKKNGVVISIDLSDPGLITRIHDVFIDVVTEYADIVFVNEDEARSFTGKEHESALEHIHELCGFAVVKLGARGSIIKSRGLSHAIPVYQTDVVNTNGAGDMYAGGLLFGLSRGMTPEQAARLASYASSLVISQVGARIRGKIDLEAIDLDGR